MHLASRYPLAEFRYGREEMLSLYDKNCKLPELLPKFNKLFIEKMQYPLALLPTTAEEETVIQIFYQKSIFKYRICITKNLFYS